MSKSLPSKSCEKGESSDFDVAGALAAVAKMKSDEEILREQVAACAKAIISLREKGQTWEEIAAFLPKFRGPVLKATRLSQLFRSISTDPAARSHAKPQLAAPSVANAEMEVE